MKRILLLFRLILILFAIISCSDDFLSKNTNEGGILRDTLYVEDTGWLLTKRFIISDLSDSRYYILSHPDWISFNEKEGLITDGKLDLVFKLEALKLPSDEYVHYGELVLLIEKLGYIKIIVAHKKGDVPILALSENIIEFNSNEVHTFLIGNAGIGSMEWKFEEFPPWLVVSPGSGIATAEIPSTARVALSSAYYTGTEHDLYGSVLITSNSMYGNVSVPVHIHIVSPKLTDEGCIKGIVTDAEFNHNTGILAICTKTPNTLIRIDTYAQDTLILELSKFPSSISISDDGHFAAVGYSVASVDFINLDNLTIQRSYTCDCIPNDVALGNNGWCYISPVSSEPENIRSLNLNTGELISTSPAQNSRIKKVPGMDELFSTSISAFPSGLNIFNIEGGAAGLVKAYTVNAGDFWFSHDGSRMYASTGAVYYVPQTGNELPPYGPEIFGQLTDNKMINAFDESPQTNSVFFSIYDVFNGIASSVQEYNSLNLSKTGSYDISPYLVKNGISEKYYRTVPRYIFVNKEGTKAFVVKSLADDYTWDDWSIETISISNGK
jgi:hypothetical protein